MRPSSLPLFFLLLCLCCLTANAQQAGDFAGNVRAGARPRLVVVISIDQFRADYLRRLTGFFLPPRQADGRPGGFRYLMENGSYFTDARYGHFPLYTGPGHAVILTGSHPYKNGIVANDWWDKKNRNNVYCVDDTSVRIVGLPAPDPRLVPKGPANLLSTTVGDELKLATGGRGKVVAIALKDRAAILLGGHRMDACLWFHGSLGRWISSSVYCPTGALPKWAADLNGEAIPDRSLRSVWTPTPVLTAPATATAFSLPAGAEPGASFSHAVEGSYGAFAMTPAANAYLFETARRAVDGEGLGSDETPDILALNLSTNDYVGHAFGPYSLEAYDITVRTDSLLASFLGYLEVKVPGGLASTVVVITADHGVAPVTETAQANEIDAGRLIDSLVRNAAESALDAAFGARQWLSMRDGRGGFVDSYIYLDDAAVDAAVRALKITRAEIEERAARAVSELRGVYACYTRSRILGGALPATEITRRIVNGFHPKLSGDIVVVTEQNWVNNERSGIPVATHGTPYIYDTHVPILIAGFGIRSGVWADPVSPADIAPTISTLLGIEYPSGCDGLVLHRALR